MNESEMVREVRDVSHKETAIKDAERNLKENPYLSIVMASRNDEYGGNALRRMQVSINCRLEQLEK